MASVFLAPHNDDETLFGAFTLLRERPRVIICSWCGSERAAETRRAMEILGCKVDQWRIPEDGPPKEWLALVRTAIRGLDARKVFAPMPETNGNWQHNQIGQIAEERFGPAVVPYLTYTRAGKSTDGYQVPYRAGWPLLKMRALTCYPSQIEHPSHAAHFLRDQNEYLGVPSSL